MLMGSLLTTVYRIMWSSISAGNCSSRERPGNAVASSMETYRASIYVLSIARERILHAGER